MTVNNPMWFDAPTVELTVRRLEQPDIKRYADPILGVLATAYTREFEEQQGLLPEGSAAEFFDQRREGQSVRMEAYMRNGSSYHVAHLGSRYDMTSENVVGVIKTSPSRANILQKLRLTQPNCYVNDVAVTQPRQGIGTALLFAASLEPYPSASMVADVLPGSEAFFRQAGLSPAAKQPSAFEPLEIDSVGLHEKLVRYEVFFAGAVKFALSAKKPWLLDAIR